MTEPRIVVGLDPSLTAYGWAIVDIAERPRVLSVGCVRTAPLPKKLRHTYQTDQDYTRLEAIGRALTGVLYQSGTTLRDRGPTHIVCEAPAGSQHAKAAKALGQALGLTIGICAAATRRIRFVQAHEVKLTVGGSLAATKREVALGVEKATGWKSTAKDKDSREGESDAVAVALTLRSELLEHSR